METIKFSLQGIEIPAFNVYVHLISILVILFLIKMTFEAPQLELKALEKGNITLTVNQGTIQFLFEGLTPAQPYESAFYFASKETSARRLDSKV